MDAKFLYFLCLTFSIFLCCTAHAPQDDYPINCGSSKSNGGVTKNSSAARLPEGESTALENSNPSSSASVQLNAVAEENVLNWMVEEGLLHNHQKCITDPTEAWPLDRFLETIVLGNDGAGPSIPYKPQSSTKPKHRELGELPDLELQSETGYCSSDSGTPRSPIAPYFFRGDVSSPPLELIESSQSPNSIGSPQSPNSTGTPHSPNAPFFIWSDASSSSSSPPVLIESPQSPNSTGTPQSPNSTGALHSPNALYIIWGHVSSSPPVLTESPQSPNSTVSPHSPNSTGVFGSNDDYFAMYWERSG